MEELRYTADDGSSYLAQRQSSLTNHNQNLRASLFTHLGDATRTILDFGCGAGGVLSRVEAKRRVGIEIGEEAAAIAQNNGLEVFANFDTVADNSIDSAISFHAIEHVENPAEIIRQITRVVRPNGTVRLIVPGERPLDPQQSRWFPNHDRHLYTWTPLIFGNLAEYCGLKDIRTQVAPMPTGSRLVKALKIVPALARLAHMRIAKRGNFLNVILDARAP